MPYDFNTLIGVKKISNVSDVAEQNVVVHCAALPIITERLSYTETIRVRAALATGMQFETLIVVKHSTLHIMNRPIEL